LFTINCTSVREKKTKLFLLVFQKKKINIATVEHGSTVPVNNHKKLLLQSCGWAAKINRPYQAKWAAKINRPYQAKSSLFSLPNIKMCGCG
jgi:hypothetical protein